MDGTLWTVVREPRFEREAAEIQSDVRRMDAALEYAEYQLARQADSGIKSDVPGIWVAPVRVPSETGIIRASVFYTFEPNYVRLQSIKRAP